MTTLSHGDGRRGHQTTEYRAWAGMIKRCTNKNEKAYANYGGRGIIVSDKWRISFTAFLQDMGRKPSPGHSIDRINNDGNYEPSNCRWATRKEQSRNRRGRRFVFYKGREMTISEASEIAGLDDDLVLDRLKRDWPLAKALATPKLPRFGGVGAKRFFHRDENAKKAAQA